MEIKAHEVLFQKSGEDYVVGELGGGGLALE